VVEGRNFLPGLTVQLQGENNRTLNLRVIEQTDTRAVAQITTSDYTGHDGARLVVFQRGGKPKTLDDNYKIVDPKLTFQGDSLWHTGTNPADKIFTTGTVSLTLDNYEFADQGSGTYRETVPLIKLKQTRHPSCESTKRKFIYDYYVFKETSRESPVQWSKLPDGRVMIKSNGIKGGLSASNGVEGRFSATGQVDDGLLSFQYIIPIGRDRPQSVVYKKCYSIADQARSILTASGYAPPLIPAPERLVEWTLRRTTP